MRKLSILFAFLFLMTTKAFALTVHVDPSGSDLNDGSIGAPFLTIQKATDAISAPGDMVCLNNGTHYTGTYGQRTLHNGKSGTSGNPIIYKNCQGGTAIIDSSLHMGSWSSLGGNLWEAGNSTGAFWGVNIPVFKNTTYIGRRQSSCASVNVQDEWCVNGSGNFETYSTTDPSLVTYRAALSPCISVINSHDVVFDGLTTFYNFYGYQIGDDSNGAALTSSTYNITIKNGENGYTYGKGIRTFGSPTIPVLYITIDHMTLHDARDAQSAGAENGYAVKFDANSSNNGIPYNGPFYVSNSTIYNVDSHGIQSSVGTHDTYVWNNEIYNFALSSNSGGGINCRNMDNCYVWNNYFHDSAQGAAIQILGVNNAHIYNNKIVSTGNGILIQAAVGVGGRGNANLYIYNNIIKNTVGNSVNILNTENAYFYGNTVWAGGGVHLNIAAEPGEGPIFVRNNILQPFASQRAYDTYGEVYEDHNIMTNNDFTSAVVNYNAVTMTVAAYKTASGQGSGTITSDPLLTGTDLDIPITSPAINVGADLGPDYATDYSGLSRPRGQGWDIGAHEYPIGSYGMQGGATLTGGASLK